MTILFMSVPQQAQNSSTNCQFCACTFEPSVCPSCNRGATEALVAVMTDLRASTCEIAKRRARYFVTSFGGVYPRSRDNVDARQVPHFEHSVNSFVVMQIAQGAGLKCIWVVTCIAR